MNRRNNDWLDTGAILRLFAKKISNSQRRYHSFLEKGITLRRRKYSIVGGLIGGSRGWANMKAMKRAKIFEKADEHILGNSDFVQEVLAAAKGKIKRQYGL